MRWRSLSRPPEPSRADQVFAATYLDCHLVLSTPNPNYFSASGESTGRWTHIICSGWAWPALRTKNRSESTRIQAPTQGLVPGWCPDCAVLGDVTVSVVYARKTTSIKFFHTFFVSLKYFQVQILLMMLTNKTVFTTLWLSQQHKLFHSNYKIIDYFGAVL